MASKATGFHPSDADWTRGRAQAVTDAEAIARRQIGLTRKVALSAEQNKAKPGTLKRLLKRRNRC